MNKYQDKDSKAVASSATKVEKNKLSQAQRRLLLGTSVTSVAAAVWHKPLINAIVLPAHAQTSTVTAPEVPEAPAATAKVFFGSGTGTSLPKSVANTILDSLVPVADAQEVSAVTVMASLVETAVASDVYSISLLVDYGSQFTDEGFQQAQIFFSGTVAAGASGELSVTDDPCDLVKDVFGSSLSSLTVTLDSISETEAVLTANDKLVPLGTVSFAAGDGSLPSAMCTGMFVTAKSYFGEASAASQTMTGQILEALIPSAHAGASIEQSAESVMASIVQNGPNSDSFSVSVLVDIIPQTFSGFEKVQVMYSGTVTLGELGSVSATEDPCGLANELVKGALRPLSMTLNSAGQDSANFTVTDSNFISNQTFNVSMGSGTLQSAMCMEVPSPTAFAAFNFGNGATGIQSDDLVEGLAKSILDAVIPTAAADFDIGRDVFSATAVLVSGRVYKVSVQSENRSLRWTGNVTLGAGQTALGAIQIFGCPPANLLADPEVNVTIDIGRPTSMSNEPIPRVPSIFLFLTDFRVGRTLVADGSALGEPRGCRK
ncbi:MAG: hypothetical protein ACJAQ6_001485 [Arenicella sp.]|jgi:hypothetical protein